MKNKNHITKLKSYKLCMYLTLALLIIIPLIPIAILLNNLYKCPIVDNSTIWSAWISILASISFGAFISIVVQFVNDKREKIQKSILSALIEQ